MILPLGVALLAASQPSAHDCAQCAFGTTVIDCSECPEQPSLPSDRSEGSCIVPHADFGRAHGECGSAPIVAVADNSSTLDPARWFRSVRIYDPELDSAERCQVLCAHVEGCEYFSYELDEGLHICYLKARYPDGQAECNVVSPWDTSCGGGTGNCAAGPAVCPPPPLSSIRKLQYQAAVGTAAQMCYPSGDTGRLVRVRGYVSAVQRSGYYMQEAAAPWSGIWVYERHEEVIKELSVGVRVEVVAQLNEYYALTELWHVTSWSLLDDDGEDAEAGAGPEGDGEGGKGEGEGVEDDDEAEEDQEDAAAEGDEDDDEAKEEEAKDEDEEARDEEEEEEEKEWAAWRADGNGALTPLPVKTGDLGTVCNAGGEQYEGVLVVLTNVELKGEPDEHGQIVIDDGSGETQLEDEIFDTDGYLKSQLGGQLRGKRLARLTGVVRYAFGSYEVHPRDAFDVDVDGGSALRRDDKEMEETLEEMLRGLGKRSDERLAQVLEQMDSEDDEDDWDDKTHVATAAARLCRIAGGDCGGGGSGGGGGGGGAGAAAWVVVVLLLIALSGTGYLLWRQRTGKGGGSLRTPLAGADSAAVVGAVRSPVQGLQELVSTPPLQQQQATAGGAAPPV